MSLRNTLVALAALGAFGMQPGAHAQAPDQIVYDDSLQNGWQNYGWATLNYSSTAAAQSGSTSISVAAGGYQALYVHHTAIDSSNYTDLTFWINGGATGGQKVTVYGTLNGAQKTGVLLAPLAANTWTKVTIPLTALAVDDKLTLDGFWFSNQSGSAIPTFYIDDIGLVGSNLPPRTDATLTVDASTPIRTIDPRLFGLNTAVWDNKFTLPSTQTALTSIGNKVLRFPGGSTSDGYSWNTGKSDGGSNPWTVSFPTFAKLAEATGAQSYITVNYGSGTPQMAAAWVAYANGATTNTTVIGTDSKGKYWNTIGYWAAIRGASPLAKDDGLNFLRIAHPAPFNIKYWEIGNECFGSWENDKHGVAGSTLSGVAHDGYTYGTYAAQFLTKMHAVDPNIKVGVVIFPGQDTYGNSARNAVNPNEGNKVHHGWSPVVLAYLKSVHILPEFLIHHQYPQEPGAESDDGLLLSASKWPSDAAFIRKMLTDYIGAGSDSIELAATETNSVSSAPGKQTVSLVNGLFLADNFANIAKTEFNACMWWNLHNASETHNNNSSLYGWRIFGDYGVLATGDRADTPANTPYPAYRAMELMTHWGRSGDKVVSANSDYNKLPVYAAQLQDGRLALLVVNKSSAVALTGHINLGAFPVGSAPAEVYQYGKSEDASNAGLTPSNFTVPGGAFDYVFPAYSMTVIVIPTSSDAPALPTTLALSPISDSYVQATDTAKHGAETMLGVYRNTTTGRWVTYLKFDLTGATKPITAAQLKMTITSTTTSKAVPLSVYGVSDNSWLDSTLSFASAVAGGGLTSDALSTGTLAGTSIVTSAVGDYTWDLTNYLKDKNGQVVTLQILDTTSAGIYFKFGSREAATGRPVLTVQY
ncbi:MAG: alpha-L-arabinofuranosidase [Capsulimonas sp.]|uniref:CBM96 family carbohydrate-binding protein n=1 Tax=Capsulimonas sp. TaxID=2494211 RepID=UPI003266CCA5